MAKDPPSGTPILIAVAPSATLKNVGVTDIPWHGKFSGNFPPYNNDQHPYLAWNMYRLAVLPGQLGKSAQLVNPIEDNVEVRDVVFALAFLNREQTAVRHDVPLGRVDTQLLQVVRHDRR